MHQFELLLPVHFLNLRYSQQFFTVTRTLSFVAFPSNALIPLTLPLSDRHGLWSGQYDDLKLPASIIHRRRPHHWAGGPTDAL